jgi:hypothetical protein
VRRKLASSSYIDPSVASVADPELGEPGALAVGGGPVPPVAAETPTAAAGPSASERAFDSLDLTQQDDDDADIKRGFGTCFGEGWSGAGAAMVEQLRDDMALFIGRGYLPAEFGALSDSELLALHVYTAENQQFNYKWMNYLLHSPADRQDRIPAELEEPVRALCAALAGALQKIPTRHQVPIMRHLLYRGEVMERDATRGFDPGRIMAFPAFVSTTATRATAESFVNWDSMMGSPVEEPCGVLFVIEAQASHRISFLGVHTRPEEDEYLLAPQRRFEIIDVKSAPSSPYYNVETIEVHLREVADPTPAPEPAPEGDETR